MSRYVVGLTGGIASGKSEVTRRFEALGIVVADADLAARAVVAADSPALARIAERFGADMLLADGGLDRSPPARPRLCRFGRADGAGSHHPPGHPPADATAVRAG